ncbi:MAG: hypothetical protein EZS28_005147 [Streblomastix strix]|uniref:DM10 domain-containing protein n=1 Tax=Streblomastix strix TaxID=222440 RepID=A0A5J4WXX1_9EUKA|nr:MAG: hypothetical protein EZS28_005147 [Streblomastix strix]
MIGRTVNIFNQPSLLYDCDEYSENYYRTAYRITEFSYVKLPELINIVPESTFLGLASLLDPDMTYTASKQQFIDVMAQP